MSIDIPEDWPDERKAYEFARIQLSSIPEVFGCELQGLAELNWYDLVIALHPKIETKFPEKNRVYHIVPEDLADRLVVAAEVEYDAFELVNEICQRNLINGRQLPKMFGYFAASRLDGRFEKPKGRKPPKGFALKWALYSLCKFIPDLFQVNLTRNEAKNGGSACDAVAEAATGLGYVVNHTTLRDWCNHTDNRAFRKRADGLDRMIREITAENIGLIRNRKWSKSS